ncbi:hypothetical protein KC330_g7631 [Hortaea werneckii]|nr:hypothetical protein KC330_g7631 [Hortaea werneckii]
MTLDYKRFRTAQLARFAQNRNLNVEVRPRQERGCYLRALIDADNDATFRFLDLPAELRNNVHEHLLRLRELKHRWKCYSETLATCKQYLLHDAAWTPSVDVKVKLAWTAVAAEKVATLFSPLALYDAPKTFEAVGVDARVLQAAKASATVKVQHHHTADQLKRCRGLQSATSQLECLRMRLGYGRLIWSTDGEQLLNNIMLRDDCMTVEKEPELSLAIDRYEVEINDSYFAQNEARIQELAEENRAMAKEWAKRMGKA